MMGSTRGSTKGSIASTDTDTPSGVLRHKKDKSSLLSAKEGDWHSIVFIIFNLFWLTMLDLNIFMNGILIVYCEVFLDHYTLPITLFYYLCELHYFADTILSVLHRKWVHVRKTRLHDKKSMGELFLNGLTLLPLYELYTLLLPYGVEPMRDRIRIKALFRYIILCRHLFARNSAYFRLNRLFDVLLKQVFLIITTTMAFASVWYLMKCRSGDKDCKDWTATIATHSFDRENPFNWFFVCYTAVLGLQLQDAGYGIHPTNAQETLFFILVVNFGFYINKIFFLGKMMGFFIHKRVQYFVFSTRVGRLRTMMKDHGLAAHIQHEVNVFMKEYWVSKQGIANEPPLFEILPYTLKKEVLVDVFWEAMRHSYLFCDIPHNFKLEISMLMKHVFMMPGDFLFETGAFKCKMVYVVSGDLQILTDEDDITPVMTFTAGTVLSELGTIIPTKSLVNIRSATRCEIHILELQRFHRGLCRTSFRSAEFHEKFRQRVEYARNIVQFRKRNVKSYNTMESAFETHIKKIKFNWRMLWDITQTPAKMRLFLRNYDGTFSFKCIDKIMLNDGLDLETKAICLTNNCPYVLHPHSDFRLFFYYLSLVVATINWITIPYYTGFRRQIPLEFFSLSLFFDLIYWLDLYLEMITAVKQRTVEVIHPIEIVQFKLKQPSITFDIISCIPFDYVFYIADPNSILGPIFKLNRLIKVYKIILFQRKYEALTLGMDRIKHMSKYMLYYVGCVSLSTCLLYSLACPHNECDTDSWYVSKLRHNKEEIKTNMKERFFASLNYALSILLRIPYTKFYPYRILDIASYTIIMLASYFLYIFVISEVVCAKINIQKEGTNFKEKFMDVRNILKKITLSSNLRQKIIRAFEYRWYHQRFIEDEAEELHELPEHIYEKLGPQCTQSYLQQSEFFGMFDNQLLSILSSHCKIKSLMPNSEIVTVNHTCPYIYVIERGVCRFTYKHAGRIGLQIKTVESPFTFPIIGSMFGVQSLITVTSITDVLIICVPTEWFLHLCGVRNGEFLLDIAGKEEVLMEMEKDAMQDGDKEVEYPVLLRDKREPKSMEQTHEIFSTFKISMMMMMKGTLHPTGKVYIFWELLFCFKVLIQGMICSYSFSHLLEYRKEVEYIQFLFDVMSYMDIYIKMHVRYYNKDGIMISHPVYTAKNYLRHSFAVDLISCFPYHYLNLDEIFFEPPVGFFFFILVTRSLCYYRLSGLLLLIANTKRGFYHIMAKLVWIMLIFFIVTTFTVNFMIMRFCDIFSTGVVDCKKGGINKIQSLVAEGENKLEFFKWWIEYIMTSFFSGFAVATMTLMDPEELNFLFPVIITMIVLHIYYYTYFLSYVTSYYFAVIPIRSEADDLEDYSRSESLEDSVTVAKIFDNLEYKWRICSRIDFVDELEKMDYHLKCHVVYEMFKTTIENCQFFSGEHDDVIKKVCNSMKLVHLSKDTKIIQVNDVQKTLYILHKGEVEVSVGNEFIRKMGVSSAFGSISRKGYTRQLISVTALSHLELLCMDADAFDEMIKPYTNVVKKIRTFRFLYHEYFPYDSIFEEPIELPRKIHKERSGCFYIYDRIVRRINRKRSISKWIHMFYLQFTPIVVLILLCSIFFLEKSNENDAILMVIVYVTDAIYWLRVFIQIHLEYEDEDTGKLVTDPRLIRHKYLRSLMPVIDIISGFPLEFVVVYFNFGQRIGFMNRGLRVLYSNYYFLHHCKTVLRLKNWMRVTFLLYNRTIFTVLMSALWRLLCCSGSNCKFISDPSTTILKVKTTQKFSDSVLRAFYYVSGVITFTSFKDNIATDRFSLIIDIFITLCIHFSLVPLFSSFIDIFASMYYRKVLYHEKIRSFCKALKERNISPAILHKTRNYLLYKMYHSLRCEGLPKAIQTAPYYLKEDMMRQIYGKHIENHFLFMDCHIDFIRQLITKLERHVYLPGFKIVEQDVVDSCMYMIHSGQVEVLKVMPSGETNTHVLKTNFTFGEGQGIFEDVPHIATYTSQSVTEVMILRKESWVYLLKWFPASLDSIMAKAMEYHIAGSHRMQLIKSFKIDFLMS